MDKGMNVVIVGLIILLSACVPIGTPTIIHPDVVYIGDSICVQTFDDWGLTAQQHAGIVPKCVAGRKLSAVTDLPDVRVVFLALVTNDCNRTPSDEYRVHLQNLLLTTPATVYCVLPTNLIRGESCNDLKQVMLDECTNTINPHDYGVIPRTKDGYHWNSVDHSKNNFTRAIIERIKV